jgi:hypothetical protein
MVVIRRTPKGLPSMPAAPSTFGNLRFPLRSVVSSSFATHVARASCNRTRTGWCCQNRVRGARVIIQLTLEGPGTGVSGRASGLVTDVG